MNIRLFYHSLVSDWNHGNAHFLRGVATELVSRGHDVVVYEPADGWSRRNLLAAHGNEALQKFRAAYPDLRSVFYDLASIDFEEELADADLVLVHEWNAPALVQRIGAAKRRLGFAALFHDTHHRMVSDPAEMQKFDLTHYDGVLAYGRVLRDRYLASGMVSQAWTWHEAADTRHFHPLPERPCEGDLVWIGNWGDEERAGELREFLLEPVKALGLKARVYGVRYPEEALALLADAGIEYGGWLPNFEVPEVFARFKMTVHVPRRPYVTALPGIPTIRPFEALACGIPLVSSPWTDAEHLFVPGDFLVAHNGREMITHLEALAGDAHYREGFSRRGVSTIRARHTCAHRVDELLEIFHELADRVRRAPERAEATTAFLQTRASLVP
jgi:spore maturation protein CgeB